MNYKESYCILGPLQFYCSFNGKYTVKVNGSTGGFSICNSSGGAMSLTGAGNHTFYLRIPTSTCKSGISQISVTTERTGWRQKQYVKSGNWLYELPIPAQPIVTINRFTETSTGEAELKRSEKTITWTTINGYLEIIKQDSKTATKLSNVTINISGIGNRTTDSNGRIYLNNISPRSYSITEISTPYYGYYPEARANATIRGNVVTITLNNIKHVGDLKIVKKDNDNSNVTLPNVTFKIRSSNGYIIAVDTGRSNEDKRNRKCNTWKPKIHKQHKPSNRIQNKQ